MTVRRMMAAAGACLALSAVQPAQAQVGVGLGFYSGPGAWGPYASPFPFVGWPGFQGAYGSYWTNGLSLYGPPIPVTGPIPGVLGNSDLVNQWRERPTLGTGVGFYGYYGGIRGYDPRWMAWYRFTHPIVIEPLPPPADRGAPGPKACMYVSVTVPKDNAEVFLGAMKMGQAGTQRLYSTPPLPADREARIDVTVRWSQGGLVHEARRVAVGTPGEVVRVDFTRP